MKTITSTPNAKKGMLSAVLAGIAGNVLEWYDFAVYGFFALILIGQIGLAIVLAAYSGPLPAALSEMFPGKVRVTAVSIGYNVTYAILGGTTPMVAVWLIEKNHDDTAFAWYIIAAATVSFLISLWFKERANQPLRG